MNYENPPMDGDEPSCTIEKKNEIKFDPPVFRQRYSAALSIAKKHKVQSVVDIGCAECKMIIMYKNMLNLSQIVGIDIDVELLERFSYRAKPMMHEFFVKPRSVELCVKLLSGCVSKRDERLRSIEMVSAIELIEHLTNDVLEQFPATVFGFINPRIAVVTTPNSEFNKYFDFNPGQMRHPDHKFEWSRDEFSKWCFSCCDSYGYTVEFSQIGFLDCQTKQDREIITGGCSQMAVFTRTTECPSSSNKPNIRSLVPSDGECYQTVVSVAYPFDSRSLTTRIIDEVHYVLGRLTTEAQLTSDMTGIPQRVEMPLQKLLEFPLLKDLVDDDSDELLKFINEGILHLEFTDLEVIKLEDETSAIAKWVYPYESSLNSADEYDAGDSNSYVSPVGSFVSTEQERNVDDVVFTW